MRNKIEVTNPPILAGFAPKVLYLGSRDEYFFLRTYFYEGFMFFFPKPNEVFNVFKSVLDFKYEINYWKPQNTLLLNYTKFCGHSKP